MHSAEDTLNLSVGDFEKERVADMKTMLKRYIQCQMFFYSKAMEGLAHAYELVSKIDPDQERLVSEHHMGEDAKHMYPFIVVLLTTCISALNLHMLSSLGSKN